MNNRVGRTIVGRTIVGRTITLVLTAGVLLVSGACSIVQPVAEAPAMPESGVVSEEDANQPTALQLSYRGPSQMGSPDTTQCAGFSIDETGALTVEACDGTQHSELLGDRLADQWELMRRRFAGFTYETSTESLVFEGNGYIAAEPWQRALLAWARGRYTELSTGRTSATINTAMSWQVGQDYTQKNICMHLTVLDYGYAYAEEILCEGRDLVSVAEDWLTTEELAALDTWLYARAPLYVDQNYIDGRGGQEMSAAEIEEANLWAAELWSRIRNSEAASLSTAAGVCPEARDGLSMVRDYQRGFCLLVPSTHTVFEPNPNEIVIARESLLNVTEPRAYISVSAAGGRDVEAIADELVSTFSGFEISRTSEEVAGHQAVVLDNVPGQDLNRRLLIVVDHRLYDLTFVPLDHAQLEDFYATIIGDLVLIAPE